MVTVLSVFATNLRGYNMHKYDITFLYKDTFLFIHCAKSLDVSSATLPLFHLFYIVFRDSDSTDLKYDKDPASWVDFQADQDPIPKFF